MHRKWPPLFDLISNVLFNRWIIFIDYNINIRGAKLHYKKKVNHFHIEVGTFLIILMKRFLKKKFFFLIKKRSEKTPEIHNNLGQKATFEKVHFLNSWCFFDPFWMFENQENTIYFKNFRNIFQKITRKSRIERKIFDFFRLFLRKTLNYFLGTNFKKDPPSKIEGGLKRVPKGPNGVRLGAPDRGSKRGSFLTPFFDRL